MEASATHCATLTPFAAANVRSGPAPAALSRLAASPAAGGTDRAGQPRALGGRRAICYATLTLPLKLCLAAPAEQSRARVQLARMQWQQSVRDALDASLASRRFCVGANAATNAWIKAGHAAAQLQRKETQYRDHAEHGLSLEFLRPRLDKYRLDQLSRIGDQLKALGEGPLAQADELVLHVLGDVHNMVIAHRNCILDETAARQHMRDQALKDIALARERGKSANDAVAEVGAGLIVDGATGMKDARAAKDLAVELLAPLMLKRRGIRWPDDVRQAASADMRLA